MKKTLWTGLLMMLLMLAVLSACGGGGGGGGAFLLPPSTTNTKAVLTLSTSGTGTTIHGVQVTVNLPSGVTAKGSLCTGGTLTCPTDAGVVTVNGAAAGADLAGSSYVPSMRTITLIIASNSGFTTGDFATVNCDIVSGNPGATSFTLSDFKAVDGLGAAIGTITPGFTAAFQ